MKKGIIYYTDNQLNVKIAHLVQKQLKEISKSRNIPIVCSSLKKMTFGDINIDFPNLKRGHLTMFTQILGALEASNSDVVFFCEHDILYHPTHFDFTPPKTDVYYYNTNAWKVRLSDLHAFWVDDWMPLSSLCGSRMLLVGHYKRRIAKMIKNQKGAEALGLPIKSDGYSKHMGYEPGLHMYPRGVDDYKAEPWHSSSPNIDLRHDNNFTKARWSPSQYHNKENVKGWKEIEVEDVPGWENLRKLLSV